MIYKMENKVSIVISKSEQFRHENKTWERLLEFFKQENAVLKNRLSEVVDRKTDKDFLALAEQFQNLFIVKDEFIDELRHDVHEQQDHLNKRLISTSSEKDIKIVKKQEKLRNEMEYLEKDFARVKNEFNKYLASVL